MTRSHGVVHCGKRYPLRRCPKPAAASWSRLGPICHPGGPRTPSPAGTRHAMWWLWNWTQSRAMTENKYEHPDTDTIHTHTNTFIYNRWEAKRCSVKPRVVSANQTLQCKQSSTKAACSHYACCLESIHIHTSSHTVSGSISVACAGEHLDKHVKKQERRSVRRKPWVSANKNKRQINNIHSQL